MKQKQRKRRLSLLAALLLLPVLAACGPGRAESCYGRVAEVQRAPDGSLSALVLDTGDEARTCVLLTPETHVASTVEDLLSEEEFLADPPMGTEVSVLFAEDPPPQTVTGEDGTQYSAQTADFLWVEDARYPEGLTLSDGTALEVWATGFQEKQYRLSDGTVLLQEFPPQTDFSNDYVGNTPLRDLSPALPDGLRRYYQDRGPLYDLTEELERADQAFCQDPENFQPFRVEQRVSWSASAPGAHYFLTTLSRTPEPRLLEEIQWTDAFDPMTGAHIPTEELFSAGRDQVIAALLAQMKGVEAPLAQELRDAFQFSYLCFWPDHLSVRFPAGSLPSQEYSWGWSIGYDALSGVLRPWAVPVEEPPEL